MHSTKSVNENKFLTLVAGYSDFKIKTWFSQLEKLQSFETNFHIDVSGSNEIFFLMSWVTTVKIMTLGWP